jgi:hypothetical protein
MSEGVRAGWMERLDGAWDQPIRSFIHRKMIGYLEIIGCREVWLQGFI